MLAFLMSLSCIVAFAITDSDLEWMERLLMLVHPYSVFRSHGLIHEPIRILRCRICRVKLNEHQQAGEKSWYWTFMLLQLLLLTLIIWKGSMSSIFQFKNIKVNPFFGCVSTWIRISMNTASVASIEWFKGSILSSFKFVIYAILTS